MKNNPFLNLSTERILCSTQYFHIIKDAFPVSTNHLLVISKREALDYFDLNTMEIQDLHIAILKAKNYIVSNSFPDGFNVGMNCGKAAGQTIFHFHCHIIPRYHGDMKDPRGGVRHCIYGKGNYNNL